MIWRRNRIPTITVQGDIAGVRGRGDQTGQPCLDSIRAKLPAGYPSRWAVPPKRAHASRRSMPWPNRGAGRCHAADDPSAEHIEGLLVCCRPTGVDWSGLVSSCSACHFTSGHARIHRLFGMIMRSSSSWWTRSTRTRKRPSAMDRYHRLGSASLPPHHPYGGGGYPRMIR